ncbi:hypothetical protein [Nocardia sp. NPDC046763]|uniref:hypothetical protein n=1 Tax=Nocardia sp. NPDC046763 TaxID=3155256 RepID=UPI0033CCAACF
MSANRRLSGRNSHTRSVTPAVDLPRSERSTSGRTDEAALTPITEIAHLSEAAKRLGHTDRRIWVDRPEPQQLQTPGRVPGQWLMSGEMLVGPGSPATTPDVPEMPEAWEGFDR